MDSGFWSSVGWILVILVICGGYDRLLNDLGPDKTFIFLLCGLAAMAICQITFYLTKKNRQRYCAKCGTPTGEDEDDDD